MVGKLNKNIKLNLKTNCKLNSWLNIKLNPKFICKVHFIIIALLFSSFTKADVLFDAYYKILSGSVHVGYIISRYEFDTKTKEFTSTYFLKTNSLGGQITESLHAKAKNDFTPISYQYTNLIGGTTKTIDAIGKKNKLQITITTQKQNEKGAPKVEKKELPLPKGTFFSTFLAYVMLQSKEGLRTNAKFEYFAVAEEDAEVQKGITFIKSQEDFNGIKVFRILNEFKGMKFINLATEKGETLLTKTPSQALTTELVSQPNEATGGQALPTTILKTLFGDVPMGLENVLAKEKKEKAQALLKNLENTSDQKTAEENKKDAEENLQAEPTPGKKHGVPGGKGIFIKPKKSE